MYAIVAGGQEDISAVDRQAVIRMDGIIRGVYIDGTARGIFSITGG
jgi:hypothetical protein